jgi:hypothetical protein
MRHSEFAPMACLLLIPVLHAQDAFLEKWRESSATQSPQVKLVISAPKSTFYMGEMIPLNLAFSSSTPNGFYASASVRDFRDRMDGMDEFIADPAEATEDPLKDNRSYGGSITESGPSLLSNAPFSVERVLNEWVRFRGPGVYRAYIVSHRVWPAAEGPNGPRRGSPTTLVLTSNVLTLEIEPAPAEWTLKQLAAAVRVLDGPATNRGDVLASRTHAGRILRFLETPEAAAELVKRLREQRARDPYSSAWHWESRDIELGVRTSPYIDASGQLVLVP